MPRREDIHTVLVLGAGPIVIGQACEFDYSGTQACHALREESCRVILVNSNPATIMTDPECADATYIEPLDTRLIEQIIAIEKPDSLLPTMGGQTALNCALELEQKGILAHYGVGLIGAHKEAILMAEDRRRFGQAMREIGLATPHSVVLRNYEEAADVLHDFVFPVIVRPSFTLGGSGSGIAYNLEEFADICRQGLELSPIGEVLVEESVLGWKEFELEMVRDSKDNCIVVCAIENLDPMGVHTGDSVTVSPIQTLTDKEYQCMRNAAIAVLRKVGVDTGGSNVQFAVNPENGKMVVIEMNPRVSRSSALASKATGFPIAKVATKLALGYTLDELQNAITGDLIPASFEPVLDYVVVKIPRFTFEKFPQAERRLGSQMKSVGEVMALGSNFQQALHKAIRGLEIGCFGLEPCLTEEEDAEQLLQRELALPGDQRLWYLADAFRHGYSLSRIHQLSRVDPWFLQQIGDMVEQERRVQGQRLENLDREQMRDLKRQGFADARLAALLAVSEEQVRQHRHSLGVRPVYKRVDSCAAEFPVQSAYLYSCYEQECEAAVEHSKKIMVLGGGPNRIGQGIEFDYCCVHMLQALREEGYQTLMVNCNPETVSTDYDRSDRLYFEPLTEEDVLEILHIEAPDGVVVQYGGQTPLRLARALEVSGAAIIGTSPDAIDEAEDRERFRQLLLRLGLRQPANRSAHSAALALEQAAVVGYPLMVRPSYVLGGRAMEVVDDAVALRHYMAKSEGISEDNPVLLDRFLQDAIEVDVDAVCDGSETYIGGIMEHIEKAGIHSGDSACSLPPHSLSDALQQEIRSQCSQLAQALGVRGLLNAQFAIQDDVVYVLEVNPRASRTIPFVSKALGFSLAKMGTRCMLGIALAEQNIPAVVWDSFHVKEAVFPFAKFSGVDLLLGPEMKSTGEVMGRGRTFGEAFSKSQLACNMPLPEQGCVFISVRDRDKLAAVDIARQLVAQGYSLLATGGTATALRTAGIACEQVNKVQEGRPHVVDRIKNGDIQLLINTTEGRQAITDSYSIRRASLMRQTPYTTTINGGIALCMAMAYSDISRLRPLKAKMLPITEKRGSAIR